MKTKLISLCTFIAFSWGINAQNWHTVGGVSGIVPSYEADIEIADDGSLYLAYSDPSLVGAVVVKKFNRVTNVWDLVGSSSSIGLTNAKNIQIKTDGGSYPYVSAIVDNGANKVIEVFAYDGVNWNELTGYQLRTQDAREYSFYVTVNDVPMVAYYNLNNGVGLTNALIVYNCQVNNQVGPDVDGGNFADAVGMVANNSDQPIVSWEFGDMSNYYTLSSFDGTSYNAHTTMGDFPLKTHMTRALSNQNLISTAWHENYLKDDVYVHNYNIQTGTGTTLSNVYTGNGSSGSDFFDFDMTRTDDDAKDVFFILDETAGSVIANVLSHDTFTGSETSISTGFVPNSGTFAHPKIELFGDVYVVSYIYNGTVYVKETEIPVKPFTNSGNQYTVCEGDSATIPGGNSTNFFLKLNDDFYDHSAASITYHSSNQTVLPDANITAIVASSPYIGAKIATTGDVSVPTWVYIDVTYSFSGAPYEFKSHFDSVLVKPKANLQFTPPSFCSNDIATNLNSFATPQGSHWRINTWNYTSILYPGTIVNNNIHYDYLAANGCKSVMDTIIVVNPSPAFTINSTPASCGTNDGSASISVSSGASPFLYQWSNGDTTVSISNLNPNLYYATVTGANGCKTSKAVAISSNTMNITATITNTSCNGMSDGAIDVTVTGGSGTLSYYWTHGAYTQDLSNLSAGPYELSVTDGTGCVATASFIVSEPTPINMELTPTLASCSVNDGAISNTVTGGVAPVTYVWKDASGATVASTKNLNNVGAGAYTITATDNNGCSSTQTFMLNNTAGLVVDVDTIIPASCSTLGSIDITIDNPGAVASFLWSDGSTTQNLSASPGDYHVEVTDTNGCVSMLMETLPSSEPIAPEICMVTVDSATVTNLVLWKKPADPSIDHFNIYRETAQVGLYQLIDSVDADSLSRYVDVNASPAMRSWRYKISSVNGCGVESAKSAYHKTIHLAISQGLPGSYNLAWDDYEGFSYPQFDLYRYTDADGWTNIQSMPINLHSFTDNPPSTVGLDYIIVLPSPVDCTPEKAQDYNSTRSNKANCIFTPPGSGGQTSGITENSSSSLEFKLYPNPTSGLLTVDWNGITMGYQVTDIQGKLIAQGEIKNGKSSIDLSHVEPGVYFLKTTNSTQKIVVR